MNPSTATGSLQIVNPLGLHARAASKLVGLANRFRCEVWIGKGETEVNGKSILGVLMLTAAKGTIISLRCEGGDATEAYRELAALVENGFGEL